MAITDKKTGPWGLDQVYNKINQGSIWQYSGENKLFTWGQNEQGELGHNNTTDYSSPTQVGSDTNWAIVSRSSSNSSFRMLATRSDGTIWSWGENNYGGLGQNGAPGDARSSPVQVGSDTTWPTSGVEKIINKNWMGAIKTDGTLWMWGSGYYGNLAQNAAYPAGSYSSPVQVPGTTWKALGAGGNSNFAIKTDGTMWAWGNNEGGLLGQNSPESSMVSSPVQIPGTTWSSVATGGYACALATKTDGTLWTWGSNQEGNSKGVLGQNNLTNYSSPVQIPGTTWATEPDKIAGGYQGSMAIRTDGTIWSWGGNYSGQLGHANETQYSSPTQIGSATTWDTIAAGYDSFYATKTDGTVWVWGVGSYGKLGRSSPADNPSVVPIELPGTDWGTAQMAGGYRAGMAIKSK